MDKKTAIVTGGNRGLGFKVVERLAKQGFHVVIASRSEKNGAEAVARLTAQGASAESMVLDTSEFASVRAFADAFRAKGIPLHALVNNAGAMTGPGEPLTKNSDGIEATFATNHLGPALLSLLLLDELRAAAPARIVNISSRSFLGFPGMGGPAQFDFDNINGEKSWDPMEAYKNSKLAMAWFTYALAKRLPDKAVTVNAVCPNFVPETVAEHAHGFQKFLMKHVLNHVPGAKSADEAADNLAFVVTDPALGDVTGKFFGEKQLVDTGAGSYDEAKQQRLWELTLTLTGATRSRLA